MFSGNWSEDSKPIPIDDSSADAFETFLAYFYKGQVELNTDNITDILYLAHKYDVDELLVSCSKFAMEQLCAENAVRYWAIGIDFGLNDLEAKCKEFIAANTAQVFTSEAFVQCDAGILKKILELETKSCGVDIKFDACIKWAKSICRGKKIDDSDPTNLRAELGKCFDLIRFKEMTRVNFVERYESYKAMFTKEESDGIAMHFMTMSNTYGSCHRNCSYCGRPYSH